GSSVAVYGGLPSGPFREDVGLPVPSPTQVSAFKKGMEMHAHFYAGQNKLDVVALRIGGIYGPLYYSMHNPVSRICHAAARNAEPDFADRPDGKIFEDDQADWTYVKDVARGIQMVHMAERLNHRVYNVASGRASSNKDVVEAARKAAPGARGQGAVEGRMFSREGAAVVLGDVLDDEGKKVALEITANGGKATYVHLNVTSEADWRAAVATAVQAYGKLTVLVNNAGILFRK